MLFLLAVLPARYLLEPTGPLEAARAAIRQWARDLRELTGTHWSRNTPSSSMSREASKAMFYTPYVVYPHLPSDEQARMLQERGYRVYVFDDGSAPLPELPLGVIVVKPR